MHWNRTADAAGAQIAAMAPHGLWFAEAPVRPEDIAGLARVCDATETPIAVGEEWRTVFDMRHRVERAGIAIVQPEMGHTGITSFRRMGTLAEELGLDLIPHATIGTGIFLAASLQASSALSATRFHEFQHSVFEPARGLLETDMDCAAGQYNPPTGPGLGVSPSDIMLGLLNPITTI